MAIDKCHICLDQKVYINKNNNRLCKNEECNGYICKGCWNNLVSNGINTCPLCRSTFNNNHINNLYDEMKITLKIIITYLMFYSMGTSTLIIIFSLKNDYNHVKEEILHMELLYFILSLIISPLIGFGVWYVGLLILLSICICRGRD